MKKSTKIWLIILGTVVVLGIGLIIYSNQIGAETEGNYPVRDLTYGVGREGTNNLDCYVVLYWEPPEKINELKDLRYNIIRNGKQVGVTQADKLVFSYKNSSATCNASYNYTVETWDLSKDLYNPVTVGKASIQVTVTPPEEYKGTVGNNDWAPRNLVAFKSAQTDGCYSVGFRWQRPKNATSEETCRRYSQCYPGKYEIIDSEGNVIKTITDYQTVAATISKEEAKLPASGKKTFSIKSYKFLGSQLNNSDDIGISNVEVPGPACITQVTKNTNPDESRPVSTVDKEEKEKLKKEAEDACGCESKTGWFAKWFTISGALEYALCKMNCLILDGVGKIFSWTLNFLWGAAGVS